MPASDLHPENPGGEANGGAGAAHESGPPANAGSSHLPQAPEKPHHRARPVLLLALLAAVAAWFAYDSAQQTPAARTPANAVALDAAGGWWNVAGDRYLELDWEGRRATLWDYSDSDSGVESAGAWRATDQTIVVQVSGAAGSLTQEYEVVGNDAELFLAPTPVSTAKLLDSWIADHGNQDDEDVDPGHSVSREAVWRPHHHPWHQRLHLYRSRSRAHPHALGRGA
jgi:hypothetical protein